MIRGYESFAHPMGAAPNCKPGVQYDVVWSASIAKRIVLAEQRNPAPETPKPKQPILF